MPVRMVNRWQNQPSSRLRFSTVQLEGTPFLGSIPQRRDPLNHGSFSCFNVCFFKHVNIWLFLSIHFGSVSVKITCSGCSAWGHYDYQTANQQGKKKGCAATTFQGRGAEEGTSCLGTVSVRGISTCGEVIPWKTCPFGLCPCAVLRFGVPSRSLVGLSIVLVTVHSCPPLLCLSLSLMRDA